MPFLPVCTVACAALAVHPGAVLKAERVAHLSRAETAAQVKALTLPGRRVRFGTDAYRLTYATTGVDGRATTATGLVLLPRRQARRLPSLVYTHGTMAARADAPSRSLDSLAGASALLFAGAGYATVAPDYLGLGGGRGPHPYMHLATEASASLDMLRAAHAFSSRRHRRLAARTFVTGFSQGGAAAMALGRRLQDGADPRLRLAALAPMSGPYDPERAQLPATVAGEVDSATANYYLSYVVHQWQPLYHVYERATDVWRGHWAARVDRLFDGRHDDVAILKVLPRRLDRLFTPAFQARLAHPDGGLLAGLRDNDSACRWAPAVPIHLYAAHADRQVAFANSRSCAAELRDRGVRVALRDMGDTGHFGSTLRATPRVLAWFARLSRG
jgi:predicted esterase